MKRFSVVIFLMLNCFIFFSQNNYPKSYFGLPVDIPVILSGTFGELRSNHFHGGIDFKTQRVEGKNILSIADGYVSRIRVSPWGYGKAIYIKHPNGYESVYAHLKEFSPEIQDYVVSKQYEKKTYSLDIFTDSSLFIVKKGEVIAFGGNSGFSQAPHLHFEIRNSTSEIIYNPLLFGYKITDNIAPKLVSFKVYNENDSSFIFGSNKDRFYSIAGTKENCRLKDVDTIIAYGDISFGLYTYDQLDGATNKNGVYSIEVYADSTLIYSHKFDKLHASETRYVNSLIDYKAYIGNNKRYQRTCVDVNNNLSNYCGVCNNGILSVKGNDIYDIKYIVKDFAGNTSILKFVVKSNQKYKYIKPLIKDKEGVYFSAYNDNAYESENVNVKIGSCTLYKPIYFKYYSREAKSNGYYSKIHSIHSSEVPLHKEIYLSIIPDSIPEKYKSKACLAMVYRNGGKQYVMSEWNNNKIEASIKSFGDYAIVLDTIKPKIKPYNIYPGKWMSNNSTIKVLVSDNFSGIKSYNAFIDDKWILMEYEPKNKMLTYKFEGENRIGKHEFKVIIEDGAGNTSKYTATYHRNIAN